MILILVNDRHPSPQTESMKLFTPFFPHIFSQPKRSVDSILLFLSPCSSFLLPQFKPPTPTILNCPPSPILHITTRILLKQRFANT